MGVLVCAPWCCNSITKGIQDTWCRQSMSLMEKSQLWTGGKITFIDWKKSIVIEMFGELIYLSNCPSCSALSIPYKN